MPDTRGIAGFGAGFSQTSNARSNRMQVELMEKKNQQDQAQQFRERIDTGIANSMALLQQAAKANSASAFSADSPEGKQQAIDVQTRTAQGLWKSTQQALEMGKQQGLYTDQEIATIKQQFRTAATLRDPVAEKKLEEQVATQGKIDTAEGLLSSKKEFDEFQTDQDIRLKGAPAAATTQNINTRDMTVRTQGGLEEDIIGNDNRIQRLNTIRNQILENPEFLQFMGKLKSSLLNKADKLGIPITEGGKEYLTKQSQFIRDSIENINAYIKEITGAQMSEKEATRLRLAQPDPGEDVLSGDGPTKFLAKADGAIKAATLAQARASYFLEKGIVHDFSDPNREPPISIDGMKQVINDKGREQALIIKANNPDMPNDEVMEQAREIVQRRFGMIQ